MPAPDSVIESWIALSMVPEIGNVTFKRLLSLYKSPADIFAAPLKELSEIGWLGQKKAVNIKKFKGWKEAENQATRILKAGGSAIICDSPEYPAMLKQIDNAPVILYIKGQIRDEDKFAIAIVGPRKPSSYGNAVAVRLSAGLAEAGFTIVSGMARGIDTVAHIGSLKSGGRTVAVLGSGIDMPYPPENSSLMEKIAASGYVMSEFPPGTEPNRENFPMRNRLISGLSLGVLVVEATENSGSLITANYALEQNREVFAVPGNINSPNSKGTNSLIKKGAKLIQGTEDIIEELAPMLKGFIKAQKKLEIELTDEEKRLCDILTGEPMHIDTISRKLSTQSHKALALLLSLELKGAVTQIEGSRFYLVQ